MTAAPLDLLAALTDSVGRWGDGATPDQLADAKAILNLDGPRRHWIGRAKGYSKSRDVAGLSLVALLTQFPPGAQGYIAASDAEQAGLLRQSMAEFVNNTAELQGLVTVDLRKVSAPSGATLTVLAADSAGAHGLRPFWLVVDEMANWPDTRATATFTMLCGPVCRRSATAGASSSPPQEHPLISASESSTLPRPNRRGGARTSTAPRLGSTLTEIAAEQRRMWPSSLPRLWLNEWCAP